MSDAPPTVKILARARAEREADIQHAIRERLGREPDLYLMRNAKWEGEIWDARTGKTRYVRAGLEDGSADLVGVLKPAGRWFALEVKRPRGKRRAEQGSWAALVRLFGGFCTYVESPEEAVAALERARRGERE